MQDWPIKEVARATGLTSRTLRHYEQIGLLHPSRVANNGYRFYGEAELSRLYRILSLRALELPLSTIQIALNDDRSLAEAMQSHLALLEERRDQTNQQITRVRQTLDAVKEGQKLSIEQIFADFDHGQHEIEVRQRWGDTAWEHSLQRRNQMTGHEREADTNLAFDVNAALRQAAEANTDPTSEEFQNLITSHYEWVAKHWNEKKPDRNAYSGLSHLYATDPRFAAAYGGQANAEVIRSAIQVWIQANLP